MSAAATPVVRLTSLRKEYGGLRPFRLRAFSLAPGARTAIVGVDGTAAEVLVNLITGATLADEGTVEVFGRATSAITDADDWLGTLDRFGILSSRAALIEPFTIAQNLAMAFTLSLDPIPADVIGQVQAMAGEAGLSAEDLATPYGSAPPGVRARCHFGRALATAPGVLILEHANALVPPDEALPFGRDIARVATSRDAALLTLTADERFARAVADDVRRLDPATGTLTPVTGWRRWFA